MIVKLTQWQYRNLREIKLTAVTTELPYEQIEGHRAKAMTTQSELRQAITLDLEERTNALWAYVREFRHSLDSERGCRMIREGFDSAVESVVTAIEPLVLKLEETEDILRACRKELKTADDGFLKRSIATRKQINELQKENERLRAELDATKSNASDHE